MMKNRALLGAMVVAVLLGAAAYATADTAVVTGTGAPRAGAGTVTVNASVNPKLTLTLATPDAAQTVDFGAVDPGVAVGGKTVNLLVSSNKDFGISKSITGVGVAALGLNTTLADASGIGKGSAIPFSDAYSINVPWTTVPAAYTASVVYTVTQN